MTKETIRAEIRVMHRISKALESLGDKDAQKRVLTWVESAIELDHDTLLLCVKAQEHVIEELRAKIDQAGKDENDGATILPELAELRRP